MPQPWKWENQAFPFPNFRIAMDMNKVDHINEYEDDIFFAEIRKQILVLTADDEDYQETEVIDSFVRAGISKPGSRTTVGNHSSTLQLGRYYSWPESENKDSVPTWLVNLWRSGNGTGVFIPRTTKSSRRHRPGRMNRRNIYRPVETKQS